MLPFDFVSALLKSDTSFHTCTFGFIVDIFGVGATTGFFTGADVFLPSFDTTDAIALAASCQYLVVTPSVYEADFHLTTIFQSGHNSAVDVS